MNEKIKNLIKSPKTLVALGMCGILLIFLSSFFSGDNKQNKKEITAENITAEQYKSSLENGIKNIVTGITGDKNPTVIVTLESGVRYSYAKTDEIDISNSKGNNTDQNSESKKNSYIVVKTSDGGEQALIVTEIMPEVRGVAVICQGGNDSATAEKIKNAVTAALNITSKRVYISGGKSK